MTLDAVEPPCAAVDPPALAGLPAPVLADRVQDLAAMFVGGRLIAKLRDWASQLALAKVDDEATVRAMNDQFAMLREGLLGVLDPLTREQAVALWPPCEQAISMAHLAFVADQVSTWVEALSEIDAFLLSARIQTIGLQKMSVAGRRELDAVLSAASPGHPLAGDTSRGTYL